MSPTMELRWVRRQTANGHWTALVLQQKWIGPAPSKGAHRYQATATMVEEWRDVPIEEA